MLLSYRYRIIYAYYIVTRAGVSVKNKSSEEVETKHVTFKSKRVENVANAFDVEFWIIFEQLAYFRQ